MSALWRSMRRLVCRPRQAPLQFPQTGFELIPSSTTLEEEHFPWYSTEDFYPARIGEVLDDRYQLVTKLGYGAYSTAWLAHDLRGGSHQHVAVKISTPKATARELPALRRLPSTNHVGARLVRRLLDEFPLKRNERLYQCLVFTPCMCSIFDYRLKKAPRDLLPPIFAKPVIKNILIILDYLHTQAHIIHTDINENNLLFTFLPDDYDRFLRAAEEQEMLSPTPRKVDGERIIYQSRSLLPEGRIGPGPTILADFGEARYMKDYDPRELVSPKEYRPPEVFFHMPWDEKVDIWCLGMTMFDMMGGRNLIETGPGPNGEPEHIHMFLQMIALFGPPPLDFLERVEDPRRLWEDFFDRETGAWKGKYTIPDRNLDDVPLGKLEGEDRRRFFKFARRMLTWRPEDRSSAFELLHDEWLRLDL